MKILGRSLSYLRLIVLCFLSLRFIAPTPSPPQLNMAPSSRLQEHRNVLEVEGGASVPEIRRAYKRMVCGYMKCAFAPD